MPPLSEHTGEHVPQKAESSRPVLTKRHYQKLIRHQILCRQDANPYSHDCFEHIGQDNHKGQRPAEGAVEVGQPGIAAAMVRTSSRRIYLETMTAPLKQPQK